MAFTSQSPIRVRRRALSRAGALLAMAAGLLLWAGAAAAQTATCGYLNNPYGSNPDTVVIPLQQASLTVGRDVANGTILYTQRVTSTSAIGFTCNGPFAYRSYYSVTPSPVSSWSGAPIAGATYYQTGVPGIAVVFSNGSGASGFPYQSGSSPAGDYAAPQGLFLTLVKVGDISPGVLQGSSLPTGEIDVLAAPNLPLMTVAFTGQVAVAAPTCQTPNVTVDLGSHTVGEFSGVGSAAAWTSFNIMLVNCPAFFGNFRGNTVSSVNSDCGDAGCGAASGLSANTISYQIDPATSAIDAQKGLMALAPTGPTGVPSAGGIAIQIADAATGLPIVLQSPADSGLALTTADGASYAIALQARYYQTAAPLTGGPADAVATFTINYQ